jgi:hypothetical protein
MTKPKTSEESRFTNAELIEGNEILSKFLNDPTLVDVKDFNSNWNSMMCIWEKIRGDSFSNIIPYKFWYFDTSHTLVEGDAEGFWSGLLEWVNFYNAII